MPILYPGIALLAFIIPLSINKRGIIAIAATILPAMGLTNAAYDQYATLADLLPSRNIVPLTYQEFQHQQAAPTIDGNPVGALVSVDIPASKSGFPARTSLAYIPPAYWSGGAPAGGGDDGGQSRFTRAMVWAAECPGGVAEFPGRAPWGGADRVFH